MLILTRRTGELLRIGSEVTVTVLSVKGKHVRLGISAPASVVILREEILRRPAAEPPVATAAEAPDPSDVNTIG